MPRGKQRMFLTHVAFICDDSVIQKVLPQVVIGNERAIPQKKLATLKANCPRELLFVETPQRMGHQSAVRLAGANSREGIGALHG